MERLRKFADFLEILIISFFVMLMISTYIFRIFTINGDSMRDTLKSGDKVITWNICNNLKQGDIVVIRAENSITLNDGNSLEIKDGINETIVKRIIATGGQTIDIDFGSGAVYVDNKRIFEEYLKLGLTHKDEGAFDYPVTVPQGYIFVMGDYRSVSEDSRSAEIGFIPTENIIGKVIFRISSLNKIRKIG